jgi:dolichol-phosphate mannosyltransferase
LNHSTQVPDGLRPPGPPGSLASLDDRKWQLPSFDVSEFAPRRTRYCICVPVINEGEKLRTQLQSMRPYANLADILICDGGSTDGSTAHAFLAEQGVRTLLVKTGPGKLSAQLRMGYAYALRAGYDGIITIDGNKKDGVEAIPRFIAALDAGYDLVQGSRFVRGGRAINTPRSRWLAIKLVHAPALSIASGYRYTDTTNGYRGYSRQFLLDPRVQPFRDVFNTYELLAYLSVRGPQVGGRVTEIPVTRQYPAYGKVPTKISPLRGNLLLLRIILNVMRGAYAPRAAREHGQI